MNRLLDGLGFGLEFSLDLTHPVAVAMRLCPKCDSTHAKHDRTYNHASQSDPKPKLSHVIYRFLLYMEPI